MHIRNRHKPYVAVTDAMSYWPELQTAVGIRVTEGRIGLVSPFSLERVMSNAITFNAKHKDINNFYRRLESKRWLALWPNLIVNAL